MPDRSIKGGMTRARVRRQDGFTLIEVMVAITLLLVGVLGTVTMIDGANAVTTTTKAREGATALARSVLEISRGVQYRELTGAAILAELEARPGLEDADPVTEGHQVESRNFVYTVTPSACSMDDDKDNLGDHDEPAVTFCPESEEPTGGETVLDRNPDDYRRVTVRLDWALQGDRTESLTQRGLVTNPVGGLGPSVTTFTPDTPDTDMIVSGLTETATYDITTSTVADTVDWSVNGSRRAAEGADTSWGFSWDLGPVNDPNVIDCTYVLQAEAFDEKGRAGSPNALTVTINRREPFAPKGFAGGRNQNGAFVDLQWSANSECDVKEYRVYRGTDLEPIETLVCTRSSSQPKECIDDEAPSDETLYYEVVAVDTPADGRDEEGDRSATLTVVSEEDNAQPLPPETLSVCTGDGETLGCTDIEGQPAPDGAAVLSWPEASDPDGDAIAFYRVYRIDGVAGPADEPTYADRFDVLFKVPDKPLVFVDASVAGTRSYWVTAVDEHFGESGPVGPVVWQP
jgi:prepilin-type N-terminal cleavage/methylation domain-containing protein